ncbi:hypothetical protein [Pseudoxanthomonas mexicana]
MNGIGARLSAFWLAWKWVVLLLVLLGLSVWLNVHQWKQAITAPLRAEVKAKDQALTTSQGLLTDMQESAARIEKASSTVASNLSQASRDFRRAATERPLAVGCAPGPGRINSVNRALGAPSEAQEHPP